MSALVISYESVSRLIREIPEHFKTQKMCNEVVALFPYTLWCVPDHLKTQEMCDEAVRNNPAVLFLIVLKYFFLFRIVLKHKKCVSKPLK